MYDKVTDTIVGASSVGIIELIPQAVAQNVTTDPNLVSVILQIVVAIATLIRMFKKSKPVISKN